MNKIASSYLKNNEITVDFDDSEITVPAEDAQALLEHLRKHRKKTTILESLKDGLPTTLLSTAISAAGSAAISKGSPKASLVGGLSALTVNGLIDLMQAGKPRKYTTEELQNAIDEYYANYKK